MRKDYAPIRPVLDLKQIRKKAGFTLEKLGTELDYSYTTMSRMERGKDSINLDVAQAWAELCGYKITLSGREHGEASAIIAHLESDDAVLVGRIAAVLPGLADAHRATLEALLEMWEKSTPDMKSTPG